MIGYNYLSKYVHNYFEADFKGVTRRQVMRNKQLAEGVRSGHILQKSAAASHAENKIISEYVECGEFHRSGEYSA